MPVNNVTAQQLGTILERITGVREDLSDLHGQVKLLNEYQARFIVALSENTQIEKQSQKCLEDHEVRLRTLEDMIRPLVVGQRIVISLGSVAMTSIIVLVFAILTHQVQLVYP
jgi:hypothetical protein